MHVCAPAPHPTDLQPLPVPPLGCHGLVPGEVSLEQKHRAWHLTSGSHWLHGPLSLYHSAAPF